MLENLTKPDPNFLSPRDLIRDRGYTLMSRIPSRPISTKEAIVASYTKAQLVADVAESADVNKANVESVLKALFDVIIAKTKEGTKVSIPQFGSFQTSERAARVGRNPQTGDEIKIPASTVMKFTAAKALKDSLND
jgi:DNA-binding protein HU-beta